MAKTILPMKMSSLIRIALKDLRAAEKSEKYAINMGNWHSPDAIVCRVDGSGEEISRKEICSVCFAGSVMAFSLNAKWGKEYEVDSFEGNEKQLEAINVLREGSVTYAANHLGLENSTWTWVDEWDSPRKNSYSKYDAKNIPDYDYKKPKKFHEAMRKLEIKLRKVGL